MQTDWAAGRMDGSERRGERSVSPGRTPASAPGDQKTGGALSRVITGSSGNQRNNIEDCYLKGEIRLQVTYYFSVNRLG